MTSSGTSGTAAPASEPDNRLGEQLDRPASAASPSDPLVETEELVEDVSIDGMCGVY